MHSSIYGYTCNIQAIKLSSPNDRVLMSVTGEHQSGKSNNDIDRIRSLNKFNNFIPKDIVKFFRNVDFIWIQSSNISTLNKNDLRSFGSQFRKFLLSDNPIEAIYADLFEFTPNLERIYLQNNQIKVIGKGVFDKLPNLSVLWFNPNPCLSSTDAHDRLSVLELITNIEQSCSVIKTLQADEIVTHQAVNAEKNSHNIKIELEFKRTEEDAGFKHRLVAEIKKLEAEIDNLKKLGVNR